MPVINQNLPKGSVLVVTQRQMKEETTALNIVSCLCQRKQKLKVSHMQYITKCFSMEVNSSLGLIIHLKKIVKTIKKPGSAIQLCAQRGIKLNIVGKLH